MQFSGAKFSGVHSRVQYEGHDFDKMLLDGILVTHFNDSSIKNAIKVSITGISESFDGLSE